MGNQTKNYMPLRRVVGKIPGDQKLAIKDYLQFNTYLTGNAVYVCDKLDYDAELRNSEVYGISYDTTEQRMVIEVIKE